MSGVVTGDNSALGGGGEGNDEAGEREVTSMDGERCRAVDEGVLGEGESSGAGGGGGNINWNVRVAICMVDLE